MQTLLTRLTLKVATEFEVDKDNDMYPGKRMVPCVHDMLTKTLYLKPKEQKPDAAEICFSVNGTTHSDLPITLDSVDAEPSSPTAYNRPCLTKEHFQTLLAKFHDNRLEKDEKAEVEAMLTWSFEQMSLQSKAQSSQEMHY